MQTIQLVNLLYLLIPLFISYYFYQKWTGSKFEFPYASLRMTIQLLLIGYILLYLFENKNITLGIFILIFMIIISSYISLRNLKNKNKYEYMFILVSLGLSGIFHLVLVIEYVLQLENIYEPQYVIPLAGMIFANIMNSLSLAIERFENEQTNAKGFNEARGISFKSAMIPQINSYFAVGLVSLPGMMTGQILSGIDPLIAVRYQIMIMAILFSASSLSIIIYFILKENKK